MPLFIHSVACHFSLAPAVLPDRKSADKQSPCTLSVPCTEEDSVGNERGRQEHLLNQEGWVKEREQVPAPNHGVGSSHNKTGRKGWVHKHSRSGLLKSRKEGLARAGQSRPPASGQRVHRAVRAQFLSWLFLSEPPSYQTRPQILAH